MVRLRQADDVLHAAGVGREAGAVVLHVAPGQGHEQLVQGLAAVVHQVLEVAGARAHLLADDHRAAGFDDVVQLPVRHRQRRAGDQYALVALLCHAHAVADALLQLVGQAVAHLGAAGRVVKERDLRHQQRVATRDGQVQALAGVVDPLHGLPLFVDRAYGRLQVFDGQPVAGDFLYLHGEVGDLVLPLQYVLFPLHLGHVHDQHGHVLPQYLIGLLLAVAGGLAHVDVGDPEEGTGAPQARAHGGLDQRTGVLGQHGLAARHPELGAAAQAGHDAVGGDDHLVGHEHAEGPEDLPAQLLLLDQLRGPYAVHLRDHQIPEVHGLGPVLLGQKDVAHRGGQHLTQQVVGFQIHAQVLPHLHIVCHR